eukprot:GHVS01101132.1.p1 GENE.GHVS01101132.1~~GHVS01101132.1.p1  ORF type:complete len:225 (+),score=11.08 GHVS01101132.1:566-1240(+)
MKKQRCFSCLGRNHSAKDFRKARPCSGCGGTHHGFLCNSGKGVDDSDKMRRNPRHILQATRVARVMEEQHGAGGKDQSTCLMRLTMKGPTGLQEKTVVLLLGHFDGRILTIAGEPITSQRADIVEVEGEAHGRGSVITLVVINSRIPPPIINIDGAVQTVTPEVVVGTDLLMKIMPDARLVTIWDSAPVGVMREPSTDKDECVESSGKGSGSRNSNDVVALPRG